MRKGNFGDMVVFDFEGLDMVSMVEKPLAYVKGVEYVLVNGKPVIYKGKHTGVRPGSV